MTAIGPKTCHTCAHIRHSGWCVMKQDYVHPEGKLPCWQLPRSGIEASAWGNRVPKQERRERVG